MEKTKEELLDYAIKMRVRGDTYRSLLNYLQTNYSDKSIVSEIIAHVDQLEKAKSILPDSQNKTNISGMNIFLGCLCLFSGIVLIFFLWEKGWISTIPFFLMGIGVYALSGGMK